MLARSSLEINIGGKFEKHLIAFNFMSGNEVTFLENCKPSYIRRTILYGRKLVDYKRFSLLAYAGVGQFVIEEPKSKTRTVALPLKLIPRVRVGDVLTLGLNLGLDFNKLSPFYTVGLNIGSYSENWALTFPDRPMTRMF